MSGRFNCVNCVKEKNYMKKWLRNIYLKKSLKLVCIAQFYQSMCNFMKNLNPFSALSCQFVWGQKWQKANAFENLRHRQDAIVCMVEWHGLLLFRVYAIFSSLLSIFFISVHFMYFFSSYMWKKRRQRLSVCVPHHPYPSQ